jgi:UDP-glucose 4-epimerase
MKILVTGAAGYIGSHLVKQCADLGYTIHGLDHNWNQNNIDSFISKKIHADIRDNITNVDSHYDCIIHLAASVLAHESVLNPVLYYDTNLTGTKNVINSSATEHFIFCSTGAAFEPTSSPYAMSKRAAEDFFVSATNYSICRFYNVCGNDGFMKYDNGFNHLIRKAAAVVNGLYPDISVYGTDYDTRDGTTIRNYTHVSDIVDSILKIINHGPTKNIECLGNTSGYSVLEVIDTMKKVSGIDFKVKYDSRRLGDCAVSILPNQSQFFTEVHSLEDQCRSTIQYEK